MYKSIAIIGIGNLGGFLAESISEIEEIEKMVIVDFDIVEQGNLRHSVYTKRFLGQQKIDALYQIIKNKNDSLKITKLNRKYIEGKTKIPKCDLTIDCRDFIYDRGKEIDVRMYISSRYLILDCRKNIKYDNHHEGKYITKLSKLDMRNASTIVSTFINSPLMPDLIRKRAVHKIELDYLKRVANEELDTTSEDVMVDYFSENDKRLVNVEKNLDTIMGMNKKSNITVCVGDKENPFVSRLVPKNSFKSVEDIFKCLTSAINLPYSFNNYVVCPIVVNNTFYIELIPETGAA